VDEIYLLGVCEGDEFILLSFDVLRHLGHIVGHLIALHVDEGTMKAEFPTVYQILDYAVDFGFAYLDESNLVSSVLKRKPMDPANGVRLELDLEHPWRSLDLTRAVSGFRVTISETVDLIVSEQGRPEFCHIYGTVDVIASIFGLQPQCHLRLSSGSRFEDVTFHRCVSVQSPEQKDIPFIPPFGSFRLMTYRNTTPHIRFPLWVAPLFKSAGGKFTFEVTISADTNLKSEVEKVAGRFQLPIGVNADSIRILNARWSYEAVERWINWDIGKLSPKHPAVLTGEGSLEPGLDLLGRHAIVSVQFCAPGISPSGFEIEKFQFPKPNEHVIPAVNTFSKAGGYEFRALIGK
jgi:AP-3 complex subunit mu